jgi:AcrR family transcriptional regulator
VASPPDTDPADLTRRERRKLEVRNRILEAAADLFAERGAAVTKVAEVCERADVAHKTFFNHFPSKQQLLRELASHSIDQFLVEIEAARKEGGTTRQRLELLFAGLSEHAEQAGPMHRDFVTELVHAVHESPSKSEHARKLHDAFGALVLDGLEAGDVTRRHEAETLTEMILGAYYVLMFDFANLDDFPFRKHATAVARFLGDALSPSPEE